MEKLKIGYLKWASGPDFISKRVIEDNFLYSLGQYADIIVFPFRKIKDIEKALKRTAGYNIDYLYISSFSVPTAYFWIREKLKIDIPFIFYLHAVHPWFREYLYLIPFLRKCDIILSPSQYAKKLFLKLISKFNVYVVPYCIDTNLIRRNSANDAEEDRRIITFMGRLTEEKGVGVLIKLLPKIAAKIDNAHLNIIGPLSGGGTKDSPRSIYVKTLEKLVKRNKLNDRIHFKGVRLGPNKYKLLSKSDIFVNPTLASEETFGMVNIEALACGVPVITTNWAGGIEIVKNNKNGYLLEIQRDKKNKPYFDHERLGSLIIRVLGDNTLNLKLKKNAMISARKYDYHAIMPSLAALLRKRKNKTEVIRGWDFFKDKTLADFSRIFNEEFLFFLFYERAFQTETFSSLYNRTVNNHADKGNFSAKRRGKNIGRGNRDVGLAKRIRRNFYHFITSA
ncbi:MAG: glycosyltransferase family 4 protein [Candidatus Omnitrophica bacterium]|nr:glycosyltransferase family 4 protein [Candidatus Omnitrophota bacterium]